MTEQQIRDIAKRYREKLQDATPSRYTVHSVVPTLHDRRRHVAWMLDEIEQMVGTNLDRAFRWLGFVQGCLWCMHEFSIADMREHNRRDEGQ